MNTVVTASSIPQLATISGVAQDPNSDLLYIASTSGYIFTWNETTQTFVSHFNVGRPLSSIDISADGKTLAVGEYSGTLDEYGDSPVTSVGLLTLSNNNLQTLTLGQTSTSEGGVFAIGWDANGDLLVSADGQWIPYRFIPAGSQSFGTATVAGSSSLSGGSFIETTADHRYVLALEGNITGAPLELYDTQAGKIVAQTTGYGLGTDGFNVGCGDINDNVGLIADIVGGSVLTLDFSLQHAAGPGTTDHIIGAHFNASGNTLYLWDTTSQSILIYNTSTWLETGSIPVSVAPAQPYGFVSPPAGQMSLSEDGRYLVLLTGSGFDSVDLSTAPVTQTGNGLGDTLSGTGNFNTFIVVRGTNNFVGVGSANTVNFDLPFADYTVTRQADNSLMVSAPSAGEGPDHLTNIQTLQFPDATAQVTASGQLIVQTTAANVAASLDALQSLALSGGLSSITLIDTGTPVFSITAAQLTADASVLGAITSHYLLSVSGVTAAAAGTTADAQNVASLSVSDTAANVSTNLDSLQSIFTAGKLTSVVLTDSGTPTLAITAAQLTADAGVLAALPWNYALSVSGATVLGATATATGNHVVSVAVTDTSAHVYSNLDALQALVAANKLTAVTLSDPGAIHVVTTAQQAVSDAGVLNLLASQGQNDLVSVPLTVAGAAVTMPALGYGGWALTSSSSECAAETPCVGLSSEYVSLASYTTTLTATIGAGTRYVTIYDGSPAGGHINSGHGTIVNDTGSSARYDVETAGATVNLSVGSAATIELNNAYYGESDLTVTGWVSGKDHLSLAEPGWQALTKVSVLTAGSSAIQALNTATTHTATLIQLGNVGAGDAASFATAAAAAYHPSATGTDAYGVYFAGTTSAGSTTVFAFLGDTHGTITPADLVHAVTLVGVTALSAADLSVG